MKRYLRRQRLAGLFGLSGASLGLLAGVVQASVGSRIPQWSGDKASPLALGLLTVLLSSIGLLAGTALRSGTVRGPGLRLAAAAGLLVPGALCFSTVGALWYVPGALLICAAAVAVSAGDPADTRRVLAADWPRVLLSALGTFELMLAAGAGPWPTIVVGLLGGLALATAPWVPDVRLGLALLIGGTLPFAAISWWTLVGPLIAVLALAIGLPVLASRRGRGYGLETFGPNSAPAHTAR